MVYRALEQGASGYLSQQSSRRSIVEAAIRVARAQACLPSDFAADLAQEIRARAQPQPNRLTPREHQVLGAFAHGLSLPRVVVVIRQGVLVPG